MFNGIDRPIFGYLVDRIHPQNAAMVSFIIIAAAALLLSFGAAPGATAAYVVGFCALWLCLGRMARNCACVRRCLLCTTYDGPNYGLVFTAYGVGAVNRNLLAGQLRDLVGNYVAVFYPVAMLAIAGIAISFFLIGRQAKQVVKVEGHNTFHF